MAGNMTPVTDSTKRKSLIGHSNKRRSIPLFNSPKVRKPTVPGVKPTPGTLERSLSAEENAADYDHRASLMNNDEEELRERQRQRAAELQQQNMASPSTPAERRKSMGPATGMTNAALVEHYSNCIKLSAENKINMKNAFNLQLIDCMSEMLRKKNPEMNNFQAASCTLDASTKIYAYRVDCVHNDTLKMAGGLGRTGGEAQDQQGGGGENAEGDPDDPSKTKKKARRKNKKTIETNVDALNLSKFDLEYDVDPLFKKNCAMFDEGRNGGVNFLTSLMIKDDGCQLILDTDSMSNAVSARPEGAPTTCFIPVLHGLDEADVCPTLKNFNFTNWDPDEEEDFMGGESSQVPAKRKLEDCNPLPPASDEHAFDMDAVPDYGGGDDSEMNETHLGMEDIDEEEGGIDRHGRQDHQLAPILAMNGKELGIVELKDQLSSLPLEYSYFGTTARSAWAGPLHWRFKQGPKLGDVKVDASKKKRRKDALILDFENPPDFGKDFAPARGVSKLTQNTLLQWLPEKITLPEDLHFDVKEFTQSFTRPVLAVRPSNAKNQVPSQDLEDILSPYDYANRRDAENFCPVVDGGEAAAADSDGDEPHDSGGMTFEDHTADFASQNDVNKTHGEFAGDNLVAAPNMVAKIQINYARVAKKMDMRRLKSTMWNMIHQRQEDAPPENPKPFSRAYQDIPGLLPEKMAENLSVALAFAALLHLANENSLTLEQSYGYLDDFVILQPK